MPDPLVMFSLLQDSPVFFICMAGLLGLAVGSFLNVVIHRLPMMMQREWQQQCHELQTPETPYTETAPLSLSTPASRCPHCGHKITALENIPLLSYLWLRGRCSGCQAHISLRYPLVEVATALLSMVVAWHFGFGWQAAAGLLFTWSLIAMSGIDIDHQLLPDSLTLPLLWLGLWLSLFSIFVDAHASIIGALAGYLVLWSVYHGFRLLTGKEGMGHGDFKLLAALGAWMGWTALPVIILLSSLVGAVVGILLLSLQGKDHQTPIPFGPYLAAAGWISLLWGDRITGAYLNFAGLN